MQKKILFLQHTAYNLRRLSILQCGFAGSGHPTSCLSAADIVAVLFFHTMKFDPNVYENPDNDRFILSKGHASALLYAVWKELGKLTEDDLKTYREFNSTLEGHPTLRFAYAEAATGSLGIGLSIGVGEALSARMDGRSFRTYVFLGDAESAEGSVWEAVQVAAHYKLHNLTAIIDCNRLGQSDETMYQHCCKRFIEIFSAFGWHAQLVDGHDIQALINAFDAIAFINDKPTVLIAHTYKGYGVDFVCDKPGFHGKPLTGEQMELALEELKKQSGDIVVQKANYEWKPAIPAKLSDNSVDKQIKNTPFPVVDPGAMISTRKAYGQALAAMGEVYQKIVVLDADVKNSTYTQLFEQKFPNRFVQCFVAEQNMVSMGVGFDRRGYIPFISTFACFLSRAHDQIRMASIGNAKLRIMGSHAGVSIGQDGPSQMGLEDIAMMRCLPDSIVLYPSDAVSTYKLVECMIQYTKGISYLRTTRSDLPVIYSQEEEFVIGGCKILRKTERDSLCIIAAGITLFEALKAYDILVADYSLYACVIDLYCVKPFDYETVVQQAREAGNRIIVVEDHYHQGGIGEMIAAHLQGNQITIQLLAVSCLPRSGDSEKLLAWAGINAHAIVQAALN